MKKYLFWIAVFLSAFSYAQIDLSSTRYGITAAFNYTQVNNAHNPSGPRSTFHAGGLALIPIGNEDKYYIQPEVVYFGAGETGKNIYNRDFPAINSGKYLNTYISVPIYFKAYFTRDESTFFGMIGPRLNFLINQKVKNPSKPYYTIEGLDFPIIGNVNGKANDFNFAIAFGLGFSLKRQLEITMKYDYGISDTYKGLRDEPGRDPDIAKRKSEQVVSLGLSYIFQ